MDPLMDTINGSAQFANGALNPQFALIDYFLPGFSFFTATLHSYVGINLNFYLPLILTIFGLNFAWGYASTQLWHVVEKYLMSSLRVRTDDEIFNMVMMWISRQNFSQNSRNFLVNTDLNPRNYYFWEKNESDNDDDEGDDDEALVVDGTVVIGHKENLHFTPSIGVHLFWYKGRPLLFERHKNEREINFQTASEREEITISCYGRDPQVLKDILQEARQMYLKRDECKTLIYRGARSFGEPCWQRAMARPNRPFSTVVLDEDLKKSLKEDVADYINPMTRRWYANRGIPYRRGYLFHGPPGTGKSSLSLALAGHFHMKIYIVSLSSLSATEESLSTLFSTLPTRCLVLLEDIDTAGLTHTRDQPDPTPEATSPSSPSPPGGSNEAKDSSGSRLSLSGLLNILDGVASKEGRILIMTTNHVEKLDKALIRPGRVDMIIPFRLADAAMTESIFRTIYAPDGGEISALDTCRDAEHCIDQRQKAGTEDDVKNREDIGALAVKFAAKIPEHEFSPAEIQGLLLRYKRNPEDAIRTAEEWVSKTRKEKKEKEVEEAEKRRKQLEDEERRKKESERETSE